MQHPRINFRFKSFASSVIVFVSFLSLENCGQTFLDGCCMKKNSIFKGLSFVSAVVLTFSASGHQGSKPHQSLFIGVGVPSLVQSAHAGNLIDPVSTASNSSNAVNLPPLPAPLETMVSNGAQIRYLGREYGLDGWVTIQNGKEQYFYVTSDGQGLLMGILFNNKGDTITLQQVNSLRQKEGPALDRLAGYAAPPDAEKSIDSVSPQTHEVATEDQFSSGNPQDVLKSATKSKAEQLYQSAESANWVEIGKKNAPVIYMFMDTECPHCHDLINSFRNSGFIDKGMVRLRLIPVGVINEKSAPEAAYLLASAQPQKDLYAHLDGDPNALSPTKEVNKQGVDRNLQIMQEWKLDSTPFSVYRDMNGKIKILLGAPKNLNNLVAELK